MTHHKNRFCYRVAARLFQSKPCVADLAFDDPSHFRWAATPPNCLQIPQGTIETFQEIENITPNAQEHHTISPQRR